MEVKRQNVLRIETMPIKKPEKSLRSFTVRSVGDRTRSGNDVTF